jgi:phospholipid transport system substrate-binding protein
MCYLPGQPNMAGSRYWLTLVAATAVWKETMNVINAARRLFATVLATIAATAALGFSAPSFAQEAPDALVKRISTEALELIAKDPDLAAGDMKKINVMIDKVVLPNVDFQRMTALSVGRAWRQATPEQQKNLMTEFRVLLLRSYSNAFAAAKDRTVKMRPVRMDGDNEATVYSELVPKRGEATPVGYRMEKTPDGWKAYDINVLGVWLVDNYRNQFAEEIKAGGVDGLIKSLAAKNATFK